MCRHSFDLWFSVVFTMFVQVDCIAATALQLLLKLKRHLKIVYGLNDARCQVTLYHKP